MPQHHKPLQRSTTKRVPQKTRPHKKNTHIQQSQRLLHTSSRRNVGMFIFPLIYFFIYNKLLLY